MRPLEAWDRLDRDKRCLSRCHRVERIDPHGASDIFDALLSPVGKRVGKPVADMVAHRAGDAEAARLGQSFEAGGDIDPVAEDVALVEDDVAEIDPDAKLDPLRLGEPGVAL